MGSTAEIRRGTARGQLRTFGSGVWIVDNWSIGEAARNLPVLPICRRAYSANRSGAVIYL
jgi:hypothetical protein